MAFFANYRPVLIGVYDNELSVSHFQPNNNGKMLGRDTLENMHHSGGQPELHPTLPNIVKNTNGHVFFKGSFVFEWEWNPNEISEEEIDAYINLVAPTIINPNVTFTKDLENNKLTMTMSDADMQVPTWTGKTIEWHPKASKAKLIATSDESEFICVTRLNGIYNDYTFDQITIEPNTSLKLVRPDCTTCYVLFSDHVAKDTSVLLGKKMYKVSSTSLTVTNNQSQRIRVLRYYK
jgi:hypothetical protein